MRVIPKGKVERVQFCASHLGVFAANAALIGTSAAAVADLSAKTAAARAAYEAQRAAQQAAEAATLGFNLAVGAMTDAVSNIVRQVKATAAIAGDEIYSLASIPVPGTPSPIGALGKPTRFAVALCETGALQLSWKCKQPGGASGTTYEIFRRAGAVGGDGPFAYVGWTGRKRFVDATVPAGSGSVTYQIRAVRSTAVGAWAQFNVNFGVVGRAGDGTRVFETAAARTAA